MRLFAEAEKALKPLRPAGLASRELASPSSDAPNDSVSLKIAAVLRFCRAELVADNYFHAVLEANKSIADKSRAKAGSTEDGAKLVNATLCGSAPVWQSMTYWPIASVASRAASANLVKGTFGMFRNATAHEARILWSMSKEDAENLLSLASLIYRRLDGAR